MTLLILSFMAGVMTVAAPCILPLLPVVIGGSLATNGDRKAWYRPLVIVAGLAGSVIIFTLLLKGTTALLGVPQEAWSIISGGIVLLFGLNLLFPIAWERIMVALGLNTASTRLLASTSQKRGIMRDVAVGAALGPVFSSCSPTYALIVAAILPESFAVGLAYLIAYAVGLAAALLLVALAGRAVVQKLGWLSNPYGLFRRVVGVLFVIVGVAVVFGLDKQLQAYVLEQGWYEPIARFERQIMR